MGEGALENYAALIRPKQVEPLRVHHQRHEGLERPIPILDPESTL